MASTDEVPYFSITSPDYKKANESDFMKLLEKEAEDAALPTNEDQREPSSGQMYEDPPGREGESANARWGEKPHMDGNQQAPYHNSEGAHRESIDGRRGVLERIFDHFKPSQTESKGQVSKLLDHVSSGDYETNSVLLQTKTGSASLAQRVRRVIKG